MKHTGSNTLAESEGIKQDTHWHRFRQVWVPRFAPRVSRESYNVDLPKFGLKPSVLHMIAFTSGGHNYRHGPF